MRVVRFVFGVRRAVLVLELAGFGEVVALAGNAKQGNGQKEQGNRFHRGA